MKDMQKLPTRDPNLNLKGSDLLMDGLAIGYPEKSATPDFIYFWKLIHPSPLTGIPVSV